MSDSHWLFRLDAAEWIAAATRELELAQAESRSRRKVLTHLRRAGGMALNGVLVAAHTRESLTREEAESVWGRSYVDHLRCIGASASPAPEAPESVCKAARSLVELPLNDPERLVRLGGGHGPVVEAAMSQTRLMLEWAQAYTEASDGDLATL